MHLPHFALSSVLSLTLCAIPNLGFASSNQTEDSTQARPTWLRDIALSPDGQKIAFTYAGQIWLVPAQGGDAVALTESGVYSETPIWSPDSQSIAFTADRYGLGDVFILSIQGGESRRLTYHGAKDIPYAFSADGQQLYFSSRRLGDDKANANVKQGSFMAQLYSVPAAGGREQRVLPIAISDLAISPSHSDILYTNQPLMNSRGVKVRYPMLHVTFGNGPRSRANIPKSPLFVAKTATLCGVQMAPLCTICLNKRAVSTSGSSDLMVQNPYKSPTTKSCLFVS